MIEAKRSATDVILALEQKIETLLQLNTVLKQDILILSNKVNSIISSIESNNNAPKVSAASVIRTIPSQGNAATVLDPERHIMIRPSAGIPSTSSPDGLRRTSRPETHAFNQQAGLEVLEQIQFKSHPEAIVPDSVKPPSDQPKQAEFQISKFGVMQKCVDKNNKAIFMANVEILDSKNGKIVHKGRTNGAGNWQAALPIGNYKVRIKKQVKADEPKAEVQQSFNIDGSAKTVSLDTVTVK